MLACELLRIFAYVLIQTVRNIYWPVGCLNDYSILQENEAKMWNINIPKNEYFTKVTFARLTMCIDFCNGLSLCPENVCRAS
jgi:hypothetical protein